MNFDNFKDKIAWGILSAGLVLNITWSVWVTKEMYARPPYDKIKNMISTHAPYMVDKALIQRTMEDNRSFAKEVRDSIDNNTRAIIELRAFLLKNQDNP